MRIAVNTRFLIENKLEGIGVFTNEILNILCSNHPEHEFVLLFDRKPAKAFVFAPNTKIKILHPPARHPLLWLVWYEWSLHHFLKKTKPDLFISMDGMIPVRTHTKTLAVIHDIAFETYPKAVPFLVKKYYKFFFPRYAHRADHIITVSGFSKNDIAAKYAVPPHKIDVIYNGSKDIYQPLSENIIQAVKKQYTGGVDYFLYAGSLHPRKNIERLLVAFDLFKEKTGSRMKLIIAGRKAWQTRKMEMAYLKMKFQQDVQFTGWLPEEDLAKLMASSFAFVYISLFEGFGIPVLNALNCDVPVIVSQTTSLPEVVKDAGLLVNPGDTGHIAEAMMLLASDHSLRLELIEKGKKQRENFSWEKSASLFGDVILKMLHNK